MGDLGDPLAANFADVSLNGFDGTRAVAANRKARNVGERLAADAAVRRKDGIKYAGEGGRKEAAEGIGGLARWRLRHKLSSNRR